MPICRDGETTNCNTGKNQANLADFMAINRLYASQCKPFIIMTVIDLRTHAYMYVHVLIDKFCHSYKFMSDYVPGL